MGKLQNLKKDLCKLCPEASFAILKKTRTVSGAITMGSINFNALNKQSIAILYYRKECQGELPETM